MKLSLSQTGDPDWKDCVGQWDTKRKWSHQTYKGQIWNKIRFFLTDEGKKQDMIKCSAAAGLLQTMNIFCFENINNVWDVRLADDSLLEKHRNIEMLMIKS